MAKAFIENEMRRGLVEAMGGLHAQPQTDACVIAAKRQMDRVMGQVAAIRDDVNDNEFDGARAHIEILKRQLADLDEKLFQAATADA